MIGETGENISDDVIIAATNLMRKDEKAKDFIIQPLTPAEMKIKPFEKRKPMEKKSIISIHHVTNPDHWVTSFYDCATDIVYIYDSLATTSNRQKQIKQQLDILLRDENKNVQFLETTPQKTGDNACGAFAVAVAVCCLFHKNPQAEEFDVDRLRDYFKTCIQKRQFTLFPTVSRSARCDSKSDDGKIKDRPYTLTRITKADITKFPNYKRDIPLRSSEEIEKLIENFTQQKESFKTNQVAGSKKRKMNDGSSKVATGVQSKFILKKLTLNSDTDETLSNFPDNFRLMIFRRTSRPKCLAQKFIKRLVTPDDGQNIFVDKTSSFFILFSIEW